MRLLFIFTFIIVQQINLSIFPQPDSIRYREQYQKGLTNKDTLEMARAWFRQGVNLEEHGNFEKSIDALQNALVLASLVNDNTGMAKIMNYLSICLGEIGRRDESIDMAFRAFDYYMLAGDSVRAANIKINIGMDYLNQGNYEKALKVELEALDLRLQCGDSTNLATYYQHIGEVYKELGVREKWKSSLEKAHLLSANPRYANFKTQIGILNDYGGILDAEKQYDAAVKIYIEMYERSKEEGYSRGMATALSNLSSVYRNLGQNSKAMESVKEALLIHQNNGNVYGQICTNNQLGRVLLAMGQINEAGKNFEEGLRLAKDHEYIAEQKESFDGLYNVAKQKGQWQDALSYHEEWSELEDSLQNIDLQAKLAELETRFQTEKKEQQIEILNRENELKNSRLKFQKLAIWSGILFVIVTSLLALFFIRQKRLKQVQQTNALEQKLLRSQMNPHFIFNSLGTIQNFMMKNEGRKAAFYLSSFSSLMRSILKNSREELITLQEEKQTLENYLNLHQLRLGEKLLFSVVVADDLAPDEIMLPPMLIQPFVENAILHGIEKINGENGQVVISFEKENNQLKITVDDNGPGFDHAQQKENHQSYALQIFKERIFNLKKTMGIEVDYCITSKSIEMNQNSGTLVTVKLPLR